MTISIHSRPKCNRERDWFTRSWKVLANLRDGIPLACLMLPAQNVSPARGFVLRFCSGSFAAVLFAILPGCFNGVTNSWPELSLVLFGLRSNPVQAISPDSVTGLVLWLKATDLVQADSTPVSSWPDASGLAHTFTQGTVARQPIYIANGVNGLPVVRFSPAGTPKRMQAVEFMDYENPAVFVVARTTSTGTIQRIFNDNGSVFAQFLWIGVSSADQAFFGVRDINNVSLSVVTLTMDQFRIIDMQVHGQSATFSSNGDATTLSDSTYVATTW
ncbi:MAG: hypothetical protein K8S54_16230, partial [Spirochaetia bacterium]|nr:hypothetical protein [Spirochaetia bacterium]